MYVKVFNFYRILRSCSHTERHASDSEECAPKLTQFWGSKAFRMGESRILCSYHILLCTIFTLEHRYLLRDYLTKLVQYISADPS